MRIRIDNRYVLVATLLIGQLICLLAAIVLFNLWLTTTLTDIVTDTTRRESRQVAYQFAQSIDRLEIKTVDSTTDDFQKLQDLVNETRLPNDGYVSVIDADSLRVIAHPQLLLDPLLSSTSLINSQVFVDQDDKPLEESVALPDALSDPAFDSGTLVLTSGRELIVTYPVPTLNAVIIVHHPLATIQATIAGFVGQVRNVGIVLTVLLVGFSGLISWLIIHRYEYKLTRYNEELEEKVKLRTAAVARSRNAVIFGLARLAESRDDETGEHLERIIEYTRLLATEVARRNADPNLETYTTDTLDDYWIETVATTSALHDIGKVGIPDAVLRKPGKLTDEERHTIEQHPYIGGDTLMAIRDRWGNDSFLEIASEIIFAHHEKWDGTGYPFGLIGDAIPLPARIVTVADVYDALTSPRAYKQALSHEQARNMIEKDAGIHFDQQVVAAFIELNDEFQTRCLKHHGPVDEQRADESPSPSGRGPG